MQDNNINPQNPVNPPNGLPIQPDMNTPVSPVPAVDQSMNQIPNQPAIQPDSAQPVVASQNFETLSNQLPIQSQPVPAVDPVVNSLTNQQPAVGSVTMPVMTTDPTQQTTPVVEKQVSSSGKPSVLVVEDEKDALDLYIYSIQSTGDFEVFGAMDGDEALIQLTQNKIDLVLLDIMMPKKDGVETLAELKKTPQTYGTPKVVMLTNIGGDIAIDKAMGLGADGYMLKSEIEPMELIGIIKQYLNMR